MRFSCRITKAIIPIYTPNSSCLVLFSCNSSYANARYTYVACLADIWSHMRRLKYVIRVPVRSSEDSEIPAALAF